jgi:hypothetical protein
MAMRTVFFVLISACAVVLTGPALGQYAAPDYNTGYDWREQRASQDWRDNTWRQQRFDQDWHNNSWRQQRENEDWQRRERYLQKRMPNNATDLGYGTEKKTPKNKELEIGGCGPMAKGAAIPCPNTPAK